VEEAMAQNLPITVMLNDGREASLRLLRQEDKPVVLGFIESLSRADFDRRTHELADPQAVSASMDRLDGQRYLMLGAFDLSQDQCMAGYAFLRRGIYSSAHRASLESFVHPSYRNMGLGSNLIRTLDELAQQLGVMMLQMEVGADQHDLIQAFKRLGFSLKAVLEDYRLDADCKPYDVIILLKQHYQCGTQEFLYRY
jgi:ribosomal protein S18 acetylase RimI-like enzyme